MILSMENLSISFYRNNGYTPVVRQLHMQIYAGEMLGVVGESGSGKSLTNLALMGLLPNSAKMDASKLDYKNRSLLSFTHKDWQSFRGNEIAMIFQNSKSAMNPSMKIKAQIAECIKKNAPGISKAAMKNTTAYLLEQVDLSTRSVNLESYPHELSAGIAQRLMIAMALAFNPSLLIADEITTGLDILHKKKILQLLDDIRRATNMAILIVSHDINLIQKYTQRMHVMYSGELMESGCTQTIMNNPTHPYTAGLMNCLPKGNVIANKQHLNTIDGLVLPIAEHTEGCRFFNRCPAAHSNCMINPAKKHPLDRNVHFVNCHRWDKS